ncbi:MAG: hypothetical protein JJE30_00465 [Desulfuromonadales bacterium]|nr:hypothetical protein [Desulfuromonadales bacterium]
MNKILVATIALSLLVGCSGPLISINTINAGMTKQEVTQRIGEPESARIENGFSYLYFKIHDHAFGRDKNHYIFAFKDEKLVEFAPLPIEYQEEGPIDKALRMKRQNQNQLGITPNAYGPGIHMDQYGRPVQLVPR